MTADEIVHFAAYGATNASCQETVPRSVGWDLTLGDYISPRFTSRRAGVTCPECRWRVGLDLRPLPEPPLPLVCAEEHGYECCGCVGHPAGKPWGWNSKAWDEHFATCPSMTPVPREQFEVEARAKTRAQFAAPKELATAPDLASFAAVLGGCVERDDSMLETYEAVLALFGMKKPLAPRLNPERNYR